MSTPGTRDVRPSPSLHDRPSSGRRAFVGMLAADVALPLAVFYGLRAAGVNSGSHSSWDRSPRRCASP